jgi:hypothetical protein
MAELFPTQEFVREHARYRSSRFRITTLALNDSRKHVLVLDNVSKLFRQSFDLIRYLTWERRFQFVSIVESFLSSNDLFLWRVRMDPSTLITLRRLSAPIDSGDCGRIHVPLMYSGLRGVCLPSYH